MTVIIAGLLPAIARVMTFNVPKGQWVPKHKIESPAQELQYTLMVLSFAQRADDLKCPMLITSFCWPFRLTDSPAVSYKRAEADVPHDV